MDRHDALHDVFWFCRDAAENAAKAKLCISLGHIGTVYETCAVSSLTEAAKALGFDLVRRTDKQEAA